MSTTIAILNAVIDGDETENAVVAHYMSAGYKVLVARRCLIAVPAHGNDAVRKMPHRRRQHIGAIPGGGPDSAA